MIMTLLSAENSGPSRIEARSPKPIPGSRKVLTGKSPPLPLSSPCSYFSLSLCPRLLPPTPFDGNFVMVTTVMNRRNLYEKPYSTAGDNATRRIPAPKRTENMYPPTPINSNFIVVTLVPILAVSTGIHRREMRDSI